MDKKSILKENEISAKQTINLLKKVKLRNKIRRRTQKKSKRRPRIKQTK